MNRLQKKCFIVSGGLHLLLALILVVGPAFLSSRSKTDDMATIDFIPNKLIDEAFSAGGNPKAAPPPPALPPPQQEVSPPASRPEPEKIREPEPPKELVKEPESLEPSKERKKRPEITTKAVSRNPTAQKKAKQPSPTDTRAKELADARRKAADLIGKTTRSLRDDLSPTTTIDTNYGPGGGGEAYANYAQVVKSIYEHAWIPPDDTASDDAITKVSVTIRSDGKVLSSRILKGSGDSSVDSSVRRTLDRVIFIAPFPDGAKEKERTFNINFNLKAKRLAG